MRKWISMLIIVLFSFQLVAVTGAVEKGKENIRNARRAKRRGNTSEEREYLNKAYALFKMGNTVEAKLFQIYAGNKLGKQSETEKIGDYFVKDYRKQFIHLIGRLGLLNMAEKTEIKDFLISIESKIPFIENLSLGKDSFYPYRGEKQSLNFSLNTEARIDLYIGNVKKETNQIKTDHNSKIDGIKVSLPKKTAKPVFSGNDKITDSLKKGENSLGLPWKDDYLFKERLSFAIQARNDFSDYLVQGEIKYSVEKPGDLYYENGKFGIRGKNFKPETRIKKTLKSDKLWLLILNNIVWSALLLGPDESDDGDSYLFAKIFAVGMIIGMTTWFFVDRKKKTVPDKKNISYNQMLKKEIDMKKSKIKVTGKIDLND